MSKYSYKKVLIVIKLGNLVEETGDAIVCPANSFNHMRGGVAGVIRQAGGEIIEQEAMAKSPVTVGNAVITGAGKLKVKHVIHAPTMKLPVQHSNTDNVRRAVRAAMRCADQNSLHSISFPGMGTGTGWVPYEDAAESMIGEIKRYLDEEECALKTVSIVAYSEVFCNIVIDEAEKAFETL
ncbi:macro domain-containing protein [Nitrolancea hollandica]|nr:macro domain-containing protein [Nitrolancea hollandica]